MRKKLGASSLLPEIERVSVEAGPRDRCVMVAWAVMRYSIATDSPLQGRSLEPQTLPGLVPLRP